MAWVKYQKSKELAEEVDVYRKIINRMVENHELLTIQNLNLHLGHDDSKKERLEKQRLITASKGFLTFMAEEMGKEKLAPGTVRRKRVVIDAMIRYGKLSSFSDITPVNIKGFDDFLRNECDRTLVTIHNYHKCLKMYTRLAAEMGCILSDPYDSHLCKFDRGKSKERKPLTEEELLLLRELNLPEKEERVRDLFIFCAYTGLAFVDSQNFNYFSMTETMNGQTYIDGQRVKTGSTFFTPILPPAMEVLKKYAYNLPHISNQKCNDYLHLIESRSGIHKPLTTHVARHSFATLLLSYDIPIVNVARMMGHTDIKTTQVYAHILKTTIGRHTEDLVNRLK